MASRIVTIEVEHEEPIHVPVVLLNRAPGYVTISLSPADTSEAPSVWQLRCLAGGVLLLEARS